MGQRRCESPQVPERPLQEICISNLDGSSECFDERQSPSGYTKPPTKNQICTNPTDHIAQEEWIRVLLEACKKGP